ncbi:MAG: uncharacterized protein KVP18_000264 [Porospora cf. gigantea A]|uniref:uncharacterized protein n=1 Tax=Porospora cf. gigantea A TaxID=2853593 RepID=UPI0035599A46|nr:MAG: hypothetical protein KVP18_000264 [Porospora cf. gigantea A]
MGEFVTIQIGRTGNDIASLFWRTLSVELHETIPRDQRVFPSCITRNPYRKFFHLNLKYPYARSVLVDCEAWSLVHSLEHRCLRGAVWGKSCQDNCMTAYKQDFVPVVDAVRLELESAERAEGFASGVSSRLIESFSNERICCLAGFSENHSVVAPYNW